MKNIKNVINISVLIAVIFLSTLFVSCKKRISGCTNASADNFNTDAVDDDGSCKYSGDVTFYYRAAQSQSITPAINQATVTINGQVGYITSNYPYIPLCNSSGCANFRFPTGSYNYTAKNLLQNWQGVATVSRECNAILLQ